jgi:hypothetical protein
MIASLDCISKLISFFADKEPPAEHGLTVRKEVTRIMTRSPPRMDYAERFGAVTQWHEHVFGTHLDCSPALCNAIPIFSIRFSFVFGFCLALLGAWSDVAFADKSVCIVILRAVWLWYGVTVRERQSYYSIYITVSMNLSATCLSNTWLAGIVFDFLNKCPNLYHYPSLLQ